MGAKEKAASLHGNGFNCAQSVLGALGEYTGLEESAALAISGGFGGGACCGELCGAISGAVMALGLTHPYCSRGDTEAKLLIRRMTAEFIRDFRETYGCVRCVELKRSGHPCPQLIEYAAEQAENMLSDNKNKEINDGNL